MIEISEGTHAILFGGAGYQSVAAIRAKEQWEANKRRLGMEVRGLSRPIRDQRLSFGEVLGHYWSKQFDELSNEFNDAGGFVRETAAVPGNSFTETIVLQSAGGAYEILGGVMSAVGHPNGTAGAIRSAVKQRVNDTATVADRHGIFVGAGYFVGATKPGEALFNTNILTEAPLFNPDISNGLDRWGYAFQGLSDTSGTLAGAAALRNAAGKISSVHSSRSIARGADNVTSNGLGGINPTRSMTNCVECAIATARTIAGKATVAKVTRGGTLDAIEAALGGDEFFMRVSGRAEIERILLKAGDGAQGIVHGRMSLSQPGHVWNAVNVRGTVEFIDGQALGNGLSNFDTFFLDNMFLIVK